MNELMAPVSFSRELDDECTSCVEQDDGAADVANGEYPHSQRACGHHCNCSWSQERCCWCGTEFGEDEDEISPTVLEKEGPVT